MAVKNKLSSKYEARKLMKYDGTLLIGEGDTKEEATKDLKELKKLWRTLELEDTSNGRKARFDLAEHLNSKETEDASS